MKKWINNDSVLNADINRYIKHFPTSKKMFEKAERYLPAGVGSTSRAIW